MLQVTGALPTNLDGKTILITGGSRGLGRAMSITLAKLGAQVAFTFLHDTLAAESTAEELQSLNAKFYYRAVSVLDSAGMLSFISDTEQTLGPIDALINNAGVLQTLPLALINEQDWDHVLDTNVKGCFNVAKAVLQKMIRRKRGAILNIGSIAGLRALESPVHYATSKAALQGLTFALAQEVGKYNIRVNLLALGLIDSNIGQSIPEARLNDYIRHSAAGRIGSCEEVARAAAHIISDQNVYQNGATVIFDGGL